MNYDISPILDGWEYDPSGVTVRKIRGNDGRHRLQMRLELGLLQMELEGRPDGTRPFNRESLLEYYLGLLREHKRFFGSEVGFELDSDGCSALRQEALMYYYRYLGLFHLQDYAWVVRDTSRNLRVFDIIWEYATEEEDRWSLEEYRPYVLMMMSRARALISLREGLHDQALGEVEMGIEKIEEHFTRHKHEDQIESCAELNFLKEWTEEIRQRKPLSPKDRLQVLLQNAVAREDYERAAVLRDAIRNLD